MPEGESPLNPKVWFPLEELTRRTAAWEQAEEWLVWDDGGDSTCVVSSDSQAPSLFCSHLPAIPALCFCGGWAAGTGWHHISLFVSDAFILWKQNSMLGIYSIAWDIFCQTCNAVRQAQCCFSSGGGGKGFNALFFHWFMSYTENWWYSLRSTQPFESKQPLWSSVWREVRRVPSSQLWYVMLCRNCSIHLCCQAVLAKHCPSIFSLDVVERSHGFISICEARRGKGNCLKHDIERKFPSMLLLSNASTCISGPTLFGVAVCPIFQ